ncbi:beta strand repeat-containing protein, partial [Sphingobacterium spiritivorum]|uniref:beta strand repeat-containing protein n=3 Tax=Sphingobacterium spiritivorum TaxID=258 RepID=UPI003DA3C80E
YDGSNFTYLDENGTTQTINISNIVKANETVTTLVNNGNGTYTYTSENGTTTTINVPADVINNFNNILGDTNVTNAITNLIKNVGGNVYYDGSNFTYLDENGTTQTINISNIVKANETVTTLVKNANGTYTYKNEKQQEVTLDPSMVNVSFANGVYTFKDAEGNVLTTINTNADHITYNNTTSGLTSKDVQGAIDELLATIKTIQGTKGDLTAGDASIVVGNGTGATLINANVKVADSGITTAKIAGKSVTSDKLTAGTGTDGRIAIADKDGNVTYSDAIPGTSVSGQNVTAASNKVVLGGTPTGAALKAFSVDVDESKLSLQNIGGKVTNNQITAGTDGQVLITEGTTTKWVDKTTISPETTNTLVNNGTNTLTSTVNGKAATASVVNGVSNTITGTGLVTTVNGVASPSVDLKDAIQAGQHKTIVAEGSGITVTPAQGTNTTTYTVSANPATLTLSGDVTGAANATKVEKIQGTPVSATKPTANQVLTFDGTNWIPKVPSVDVTGVTGGKALTSTDLDLSTNAGTALLKDVTANIKAKAVTAGKLGATAADAGKVATANADGTVTYQAISATNLANAKNLTAGDGSISVASGTGATLVDANVKVTDGGITSIKLADKNVTAAKLGASAADAGKVATANADGTVTYQAISAGNLTNAKTLSAGDGSIVVGAGTGATLVDANVKVADAGITTIKLADKNVTAGKIAPGAANQVLVTDATGANAQWVAQSTLADNTTADNGLTKTGNNVQLGGSLTKATTITATATNTLAVAGLQNTAAAAYNGTNGISTDRVVVADASGVLKQVKATMPKFFYMPSIIVPTAADQFVAETGVSGESFGTINLYDRYKKQFGTPMAQNAAVTTALPVLPSGELDYYITWYDTNVFASVSVSNAGILTYTVKANADVTIGSFMNIVFAVKP